MDEAAPPEERCPRCGAEVRDGAKVCGECLLPLTEEQLEEDPRSKLLREAWESKHPERVSAYAAWKAQAVDPRQAPPPGHVATVGMVPRPRPTGRYVPLDSRRRLTTAALGACVFFDLVYIAYLFDEINLLKRVRDGGTFTEKELDVNDSRIETLSTLYYVVLLLVGILFIRWFHRAYKNVDAVTVWPRRYGTGWAIGGWFVPVLGLWRPKQIANDLWRAGAPRGEESGPEGYPADILLAWWVTFTLSWAVWRVADGLQGDAETPDSYIASDWVGIAALALEAIAAVLAILVMKHITRRLNAKRAEVEAEDSAQLSPPGPEAVLPA